VVASGVLIDERHEIEQLLGRGGMGEVFRARDVRTGQSFRTNCRCGWATPSGDDGSRPWPSTAGRGGGRRVPSPVRRRCPCIHRCDTCRRAVDRRSTGHGHTRDHGLERHDREPPNPKTVRRCGRRSTPSRPSVRWRRTDDRRSRRDPRLVPGHLAVRRGGLDVTETRTPSISTTAADRGPTASVPIEASVTPTPTTQLASPAAADVHSADKATEAAEASDDNRGQSTGNGRGSGNGNESGG
jgi:serine/threonine protein kinase